MKVHIIGIAGGSGSGKSTFARHLQESFPEQIALITSDNYYKNNDHIPFEKRQLLNYDAPDALEFSLMARQLKELKAGHAIECPVYDFTEHTRSHQTLHIEPKPVILIDGILILSDPALRKLMDLKIFVEADADERILRRTRRDMIERGRTIESVMEQYLTTVKPMHNLYVEPSKLYADLIVNGGQNPKAVDVVRSWICTELAKDQKPVVIEVSE